MKPVLIFGAALVLILAGFFVLSQTSGHAPLPGDEEQIACTMDALLCPDGSSVGRTGPDCHFSACPAMEHVDGTLEQTTEGFRLVLGTPLAGTQEVTYTMPLEIKVSNVLQEFINKKVRVTGTFSEGNTLIVDHLDALPGTASNPNVGTVTVGETVHIHGVNITLNEIVNDSRCPTDVMCITAGFATANVTLQSDTDTETRDITSDEGPIAFDSFLVELKNIEPAPLSTETIDQSAYVVTFGVVSTTI